MEAHMHTENSRGFLRLNQVLELVPVSSATWWRLVKDGLYPAPVKLSDRCTAWRKSDIEALCQKLSAGK